ncbi:hypothetical protein LIA77_00890 [Sarocladium implicatum]|jgi:hypothetical protein|nr:hypothetical protein LIA77_00890 [Sarocladium implicatum]
MFPVSQIGLSSHAQIRGVHSAESLTILAQGSHAVPYQSAWVIEQSSQEGSWRRTSHATRGYNNWVTGPRGVKMPWHATRLQLPLSRTSHQLQLEEESFRNHAGAKHPHPAPEAFHTIGGRHISKLEDVRSSWRVLDTVDSVRICSSNMRRCWSATSTRWDTGSRTGPRGSGGSLEVLANHPA